MANSFDTRQTDPTTKHYVCKPSLPTCYGCREPLEAENAVWVPDLLQEVGWSPPDPTRWGEYYCLSCAENMGAV